MALGYGHIAASRFDGETRYPPYWNGKNEFIVVRANWTSKKNRYSPHSRPTRLNVGFATSTARDNANSPFATPRKAIARN
jgi:hypothetical protein